MTTDMARLETRPSCWWSDDRGAALVAVLLATAVLSALGAAVTVAANMETTIASTFRMESELSYAAEASVERSLQDVRVITNWSDIVAGVAMSSFLDPVAMPVLPSGGTLDVPALTRQLQAATDSAYGDPNTPRWRVFSSGRFADLAGPASIDSAAYLVVWVADDASETDGSPAVDGNDVLLVHGQAIGSGGRTRALDVTVTRAGAPAGQPGLRVISWREGR
jgi:hypothetical protein